MRGVTSGIGVFFAQIGFLLTRLMRGVTLYALNTVSIVSFLLTRLMRGVTTCLTLLYSTDNISTHTPHARRDHRQ